MIEIMIFLFFQAGNSDFFPAELLPVTAEKLRCHSWHNVFANCSVFVPVHLRRVPRSYSSSRSHLNFEADKSQIHILDFREKNKPFTQLYLQHNS